MTKKKELEIYLITARYSFLKNDLEKWLKKINLHNVFKEIHYNKNNQQPHLYKEEKIKKLNLDIFVEDNYDIVHHLNQQTTSTKIWWISNLCDQKINYKFKFKNLKEVAKKIEKLN